MALVRDNTTVHIEGGLVYWDTPFPLDRAWRALSVGDRQIPMNRCAVGDWRARHPGARVFTIPQMFDRPLVSYQRDHLRPLIHTATAPE
jgi:hypothetical protein